MNTKEVTVLMLEDDEIDVAVAKRAFKKARITNPIINAEDGLIALDILRGKDRLERPYFVMLDLNMPRMKEHCWIHPQRKRRRGFCHSDLAA